MGYLSDAASPDDIPQDTLAPQYGGFLSENPPPAAPAAPARAPDWSEIPQKALVNTPASAKQFGENIYETVRHPINTLENIGYLALGTMQKAGVFPNSGDPQQDYTKYPEAVGKMVMDRYGSIDNFKTTLAKDPVGVAADISTILLGPEAMLRNVPVLGKTITAARVATDPLTLPTAALKTVGKGAAMAAGYDTGAGMKNMEEAARAGYEGGDAAEAFRANQEQKVPVSDIVDSAYQALKNIKKDGADAYNLGMAQNIKPKNNILSFNDIGQAMTDAHNIKTFKGIPLDPSTEGIRNKIDDLIIKWVQLDPRQYHTPEGFDALKKAVGFIKDQTEASTPERAIANTYYNAIRNTIAKQVPEYSKMMEQFSDFKDLVRQLEKTFSLPADERKLNVDTALRKLQSVMRKNVNTNFGQRAKLMDYLEENGAPNLRSAIAGQALSSTEAHGLARIIPALTTMNAKGILHAAGSLGLTSPYAMGRTFYHAGQLARPFRYLPPKTLQATQEVGRWVPPSQKRGGAVNRALRVTKRKQDNG